jgi:hypothetical protein
MILTYSASSGRGSLRPRACRLAGIGCIETASHSTMAWLARSPNWKPTEVEFPAANRHQSS